MQPLDPVNRPGLVVVVAVSDQESKGLRVIRARGAGVAMLIFI